MVFSWASRFYPSERTWGGFLKGPPARSKIPTQDFGTRPRGWASPEPFQLLPRGRLPQNTSRLTISQMSRPSSFYRRALLTAGARGMLPLYGPGGHPPPPHPGTTAHPGGLARRRPDAPSGGLPSSPHSAGGRWGLQPGRRPGSAHHAGDGVVLEAALPAGRSHRPAGHRSRSRPQATDHGPQGPANRAGYAPDPTSQGQALDYREHGASPRGQPGDGPENLGPLRAEAAPGRSPSGYAGYRPRGGGTLSESARQGVGARLGTPPPPTRREAESGLGLDRGREADRPRWVVASLAGGGAHGGGRQPEARARAGVLEFSPPARAKVPRPLASALDRRPRRHSYPGLRSGLA